VFDDPAGEIAGVVGHEFRGWEGLDFWQVTRVDHMGAGDEDVIEDVTDGTTGIVPTGVPDLSSAPIPIRIAVGFRGVIVVS